MMEYSNKYPNSSNNMSINNSKNTSPRTLALLNASLITLIVVVLSIILVNDWIDILLLSIGTFFFSFWMYYSTINYFVYRKIKLIYKLISETKATKKEEYYLEKIVPLKSMDEVKNDVEKWANKKNIEIENLRSNEQFRKEFLMNLAHELKTPIFTTQGYIYTLLDGAMKDETVSLQFLNKAAKGIDRLAALTKDIEHITKLESGKIPLEKSSFIFQDLVKDIFEELAIIAENKNILLNLKKGTEIPTSVKADKEKIKQVMVNLISNAIKYGHDGSHVTVGTYILDSKQVLVEVSDDGPGIKEEYLPRLFERFYRADMSRDRKIGGTGLGLAIVKHIIEAHGHTVSVRSKVNVGTTFGFTLDK